MVDEKLETQTEVNAETEVDDSFDAPAKAMGWVDADNFKGDPEKHISAKDYVQRGEKSIPLLLANQKKLAKQVTDMQRGITAQNKLHETEQKRLEEHYEAQMRKAVKDADTVSYDAAEKARNDARESTTAKSAEEAQSAVYDFSERNDWYETDEAMTAAAIAKSQKIAQASPDISISENLTRVESYIKKEFPHKFGGTTTLTDKMGSKVIGPSGVKSAGGSKTFANLPADAKESFKTFQDMGVFKKGKDGEKQYLETYDWE